MQMQWSSVKRSRNWYLLRIDHGKKQKLAKSMEVARYLKADNPGLPQSVEVSEWSLSIERRFVLLL